MDEELVSADAGAIDDGSGSGVVKLATYRRRWLMLGLFCLATATNAIIWITTSPINSLTQEYYGVGANAVNGLSIVFLAAYVPVSLLTNWVFGRYGVRNGMVLATGLNLLSGLVRFLSTESNEAARSNGFAILMVGQTLGAIAQPFFTNIPVLLASVWFPKDERDLATVVGALFNPVGIAIGSVLPTFFVIEETSVNMFDLLLVEFIITGVSFALVLTLFRDKPPLPPSLSESTKASQAPDLKAELKLLFSNRNYLILFVCFGMGLGFFNALTTLVEQFVGKSGYSTDDASLFSGLLIGVGIIFAIITGLVLDRTHAYNKILKTCFGCAGVFIVVLLLVMRPDNTVALSIVFALMGAVMLPLLPVAFECAAECTYPISEDLSTGGLMSAGQITGIVFIAALGALLDDQPEYEGYVFEPAYIVILVSTVFFVAGAMFYNGPTLRLQADVDARVATA